MQAIPERTGRQAVSSRGGEAQYVGTTNAAASRCNDAADFPLTAMPVCGGRSGVDEWSEAVIYLRWKTHTYSVPAMQAGMQSYGVPWGTSK